MKFNLIAPSVRALEGHSVKVGQELRKSRPNTNPKLKRCDTYYFQRRIWAFNGPRGGCEMRSSIIVGPP